jgi:hypothetical protein
MMEIVLFHLSARASLRPSPGPVSRSDQAGTSKNKANELSAHTGCRYVHTYFTRPTALACLSSLPGSPGPWYRDEYSVQPVQPVQVCSSFPLPVALLPSVSGKAARSPRLIYELTSHRLPICDIDEQSFVSVPQTLELARLVGETRPGHVPERLGASTSTFEDAGPSRAHGNK